MNESEHLLTYLAEECAEISHRVSKALRFGLHEIQSGQARTNGERIIDEVYDLAGVLELCLEHGILRQDIEENHAAVARKKEKVKKYMAMAHRLGTLQGDSNVTQKSSDEKENLPGCEIGKGSCSGHAQEHDPRQPPQAL